MHKIFRRLMLVLLVCVLAFPIVSQSASAYYPYNPIYSPGYYSYSWSYGWSGWDYNRVSYRYHYPYYSYRPYYYSQVYRPYIYPRHVSYGYYPYW